MDIPLIPKGLPLANEAAEKLFAMNDRVAEIREQEKREFLAKLSSERPSLRPSVADKAARPIQKFVTDWGRLLGMDPKFFSAARQTGKSLLTRQLFTEYAQALADQGLTVREAVDPHTGKVQVWCSTPGGGPFMVAVDNPRRGTSVSVSAVDETSFFPVYSATYPYNPSGAEEMKTVQVEVRTNDGSSLRLEVPLQPDGTVRAADVNDAYIRWQRQKELDALVPRERQPQIFMQTSRGPVRAPLGVTIPSVGRIVELDSFGNVSGPVGPQGPVGQRGPSSGVVRQDGTSSVWGNGPESARGPTGTPGVTLPPLHTNVSRLVDNLKIK